MTVCLTLNVIEAVTLLDAFILLFTKHRDKFTTHTLTLSHARTHIHEQTHTNTLTLTSDTPTHKHICLDWIVGRALLHHFRARDRVRYTVLMRT